MRTKVCKLFSESSSTSSRTSERVQYWILFWIDLYIAVGRSLYTRLECLRQKIHVNMYAPGLYYGLHAHARTTRSAKLCI